MLTGSAPVFSRDSIGLTDLSYVRQNLDRWAAQGNHTWGQLSDQELSQKLGKISQIKRLLEKHCISPRFREALADNPAQAIAQANLQVNPEDFVALGLSTADRIQPLSSDLQDFFGFAQERLHWMELGEISNISNNLRYKSWRTRQIARNRFQVARVVADTLLHIPVCFELSKGCSIGCAFCAISAPCLEDIFFYTPENAQRWQQTLNLLKEILGTAAGAGFCYWATDPLDNPDYEQFMLDFHAILGIFPQTTTAQPMKDPARMRALLKLAFEKGCKLNRFSILSEKVLEQVYAEFSAEDLTFVGMVPQNPDAVLMIQFPMVMEPARKIKAGRALDRYQKQGEGRQGTVEGTIACVSGFLFNMVESTVQLISPCSATERYPLGYIVFEKGTFSSVDDLRLLLDGMIDRHMPLSVPRDRPLRFYPDLQVTEYPDGFQLSTLWHTARFHDPAGSGNSSDNSAPFRRIGSLIQAGTYTAEAIVKQLASEGISASASLDCLDQIFRNGVLDESPESSS